MKAEYLIVALRQWHSRNVPQITTYRRLLSDILDAHKVRAKSWEDDTDELEFLFGNYVQMLREAEVSALADEITALLCRQSKTQTNSPFIQRAKVEYQAWLNELNILR